MSARKRVLVAEAADAVRTVAESVLRQNGFEVIAVSSADKAKEVLQFARPDLMIMGADLATSDNRPYYEKVQNDPKTSSIPLLVFESVEHIDVPFPPEVIIPRPFDPKDLIDRVRTFSGSGDLRPSRGGPLATASVDDEFLDAALGLDRIHVTDSEVLNRTSTGLKVPTPQHPDHVAAFSSEEPDAKAHVESQKVESLIVNEDQTDIRRTTGKVSAPPPATSGASKLEIMSDQYGMTDPDAFKGQHSEPKHDYDWFISSIRDENAPATTTKPAAKAPSSDSQSLNIAHTPSMLDPHTPGPASPVESQSVPERPAAQSRTVGVEKFIDEFKREIELLRSSEPDGIFVEDGKSSAENGQSLSWEETLEHVTPQQVELFTRQLAKEIGERVAEKLVSRIDPNKLLQLIKTEILTRQKRPGS